jgi:hypothetical protein
MSHHFPHCVVVQLFPFRKQLMYSKKYKNVANLCHVATRVMMPTPATLLDTVNDTTEHTYTDYSDIYNMQRVENLMQTKQFENV